MASARVSNRWPHAWARATRLCNSLSARARGRPMCCSKHWPRGRPVRHPTIGSSTRTSFPKAGDYSAGVQRQYCGALGKKANCQIAVSLHRAGEQGGTSQPLAWRLYLPESWSADPIRRQRAGIPPQMVHQSKLDLALGLIDQALGWQVPAGIVLADEAYGGSFEWRAALRQRGLRYCVRVPWTTTAWSEEPRFGVPAISHRGRARAPPAPALARAEEPARHRPGAACLGVEARDLATRQQRGATRALRRLEPVGRQRLAAGTATRARGRGRLGRVARGGTPAHALLVGGAGAQALLAQARCHGTRTLARRARLPGS